MMNSIFISILLFENLFNGKKVHEKTNIVRDCLFILQVVTFVYW
jgi:hypothetical protein